VNEQLTTLLAVAPHPDDGELICGGLLAKLVAKGHRVGIIDLTRGEMGTSGDERLRAEEAEKATRILGLSFRDNLDMGDGQLVDSPENRMKIAQAFRVYRPRLVVTCSVNDRHPDHVASALLVKGATLMARLRRAPLEGPIHCVERIFYSSIHETVPPDFVVDISEHFDKKRQALEAYHSQFVKPDRDPSYRHVGVKDYIRTFTARAIHFGSQIGTQYGEGFTVDGPIRIDHPEEVFTT